MKERSTTYMTSSQKSVSCGIPVSPTAYQSLNSKMTQIQQMLRRIQDDEREDSQRLVQLMERSEQIEKRAIMHIDRCGSMKNILAGGVEQRLLTSPGKQESKEQLTQRPLRRVHSLESGKDWELARSCSMENIGMLKGQRKVTRLNYLNRYINLALEELENSSQKKILKSRQNRCRRVIEPIEVAWDPKLPLFKKVKKQEHIQVKIIAVLLSMVALMLIIAAF